jgi:hypothetical protein
VSPTRGRKPDRIDAVVARLGMLESLDRERAAQVAIEVIAAERVHRALEPALRLIEGDPPTGARQPLRARYFDLAEDGLHRDADCELRASIVRILRQVDSRADHDIAEAGLRTIQITPYGGVDIAQPLRAESLLLLAQGDDERADYFAAEMLSDPHTSAFSGEPAVTAIRLLDQRRQWLPIWALARRPGLQVDVLAQAFASLRRAPPDLQLEAIADHLKAALARGEEGEPVALVAAEAIVLNSLAGGYELVVGVLKDTENVNLFRYLASAALRSESADLHSQVAVLHGAVGGSKQGILRELLGR